MLSLTPEQNEKVLSETGICFLFAQGYHKSMKNVAPVRKGMGERTIFNVLGPLSNPARATMQLLGVYDENLVMPMAQVLSNLGVTRGMVVCGGGMDEASLIGENKVCEIRDGRLIPYQLSPEKYGLSLCTVDDLRGGSPKVNAQITRDILSGREQGAKREEILLNAGIALYLGLDGLTLADGIKKAAELIDSGAALPSSISSQPQRRRRRRHDPRRTGRFCPETGRGRSGENAARGYKSAGESHAEGRFSL